MAITNQDIAEIAQEVIDSKAPAFIELESFSTKLSDESKEIDDTLKVGVYAKGTVADFDASTQNYEDENGNGLDYKSVTLSKHLKSTFAIAKQTTAFEMQSLIRGAMMAVAGGAAKYCYDLILAANYSGLGFTGLASAFDSDDVADLWQVAQDAEYNAEGRSLVLTNPYYTSLLKDTALKQWDNSNSDETLRRSIVRQLNDFEVLSSNTLATATGATGGATENLVGFITDKAAMAVATALPAIQDDESANLVSFITSAQAPNGLTMQIRKHYNPATGTVYGTAEMLIGRAVADATRLHRLRSAP